MAIKTGEVRRHKLLPSLRYWWLAGATLLGIALFTGLATATARAGFPLDDAWIHQTYARNLVESGRWEYVSGQTSAGSTAPLWTLLLAVGYAFRLPYLLWAYLLGGLSLLWLALAGMWLWRCLWPEQTDSNWLAGLAMVLTWSLVWAATSGMETLLFVALGFQVLVLYYELKPGHKLSREYRRSRRLKFPFIGTLSGLLILTRPEGLVLLLFIALALSLTKEPLQHRIKHLGIFLGTALLILFPYFAFNLWANGSIWPNTFYAKQVEYMRLLAQPLPFRLSQLLFFSVGGPPTGWRGISSAHLVLAPGLVIAAWQALRMDWKEQRLYYLLPLLWAGGHVFLYAWRLPVTYQHGRYLFAAIPIWILYGLAGWRLLLSGLPSSGRVARLAWQVVSLTFVALTIIFLLLGAQAYANDVAFIEGEMVAVAHWLARNTPGDALIASHDIGAIGYFADRPLLDLAGLISPHIIPLLKDESALSRYILASHADYLVTAPGWPYPDIVSSDVATLVYTTGFAWTQEQGMNNMAVYRLRRP